MYRFSSPYLWLPLLTLLLLCHVGYLATLSEDAFITYRYGRNLAATGELTWNPGEVPIEGYTNFSWVLLSAGAIELGLPVPTLTVVFGMLGAVCILLVAWRFGRDLLGLSARRALGPCMLIALSGPLASWASSGMEMTCFALLVLASLYYFGLAFQTEVHGDLYPAYLLMLVAALTRPEGLMVFLVLSGLGVFFRIANRRISWSNLLLPILVFAVPFAVYIAWRVSYFGALLPNTYYAKTGGTVHQYLRGAIYAGHSLACFAFPCAVPLLGVFFRPSGRLRPLRLTSSTSMSWRMETNAGSWVLLLVSLVYTAYIVFVGGDYMPMARFFVPVLPLVYLLAGQLLDRVDQGLRPASAGRLILRGLFVVAALGILFHSTPWEARLLPCPSRQAGNWRGVQKERWHLGRLTVIGQFFESYKRSPRESLATNAIGVISWYARMVVYGLHGLDDPKIARMEQGVGQKELGRGMAGHEKADVVYILEQKRPTYYMFERRLRQKPYRPPLSGTVKRIFEHRYQLQSAWIEDPFNDEAGYFSFFELKPAFRDVPAIPIKDSIRPAASP